MQNALRSKPQTLAAIVLFLYRVIEMEGLGVSRRDVGFREIFNVQMNH